MAKPTVRDLSFTGAMDASVTISRWPQPLREDARGLPWRRRLAWCFRALADRIDGEVSYAVQGEVPGGTTPGEMWDAITHGAAAGLRYLNDLEQERKVR